jgi:hypothetical protein
VWLDWRTWSQGHLQTARDKDEEIGEKFDEIKRGRLADRRLDSPSNPKEAG